MLFALQPEWGNVSCPIPGLLSEEVKTFYAHAPQNDDKRISRGHSSWSTRPRENDFPVIHTMVPTKNLHWSIRAQLAKLGGNRPPQMGVSPDAVPGYIAAMRGGNSVGDGKDKVKQPLVWKPKSAPVLNLQPGGEVRSEKDKTDPHVGLFPDDFARALIYRIRIEFGPSVNRL